MGITGRIRPKVRHAAVVPVETVGLRQRMQPHTPLISFFNAELNGNCDHHSSNTFVKLPSAAVPWSGLKVFNIHKMSVRLGGNAATFHGVDDHQSLRDSRTLDRKRLMTEPRRIVPDLLPPVPVIVLSRGRSHERLPMLLVVVQVPGLDRIVKNGRNQTARCTLAKKHI